jgi:preprotein translocase subunit SecB
MADQDQDKDQTKTDGNGADSQGGTDPAAAGQTQDQQQASGQQGTGLTIHTQYVKDLSFENPNSPRIYINMKESPSVSVNLDVQAARLQQNAYEVILSCEVKATIQEQTAFMVELKYAGLVSVGENVTDEQREILLLIETPRHLFPFARNVISGCSRDGGFPPLLINPVDFVRLYRDQKARHAESQQQADQPGESAGQSGEPGGTA